MHHIVTRAELVQFGDGHLLVAPDLAVDAVTLVTVEELVVGITAETERMVDEPLVQRERHRREDHPAAADLVENILQAENFGADKLYLYDDTDNKNSYKGNNLLYAAYLALNIPWQRFNVYAGVRLENRNMTLTNYISSNAWISKDTDFDNTDFFPSVNVSYI